MPTQIRTVRVGEIVFDSIAKTPGWLTVRDLQKKVEQERPGTSPRAVENALLHLRKSGLVRAYRPPPNEGGPGYPGYRYKRRPYLRQLLKGETE